MSLVRTLSQTRLGKWLYRQKGRGTLGALITRISAALRGAEQRLVARRPANAQHDRKQRAILEAFEQNAQAGPAEKAPRT